MYSIIKLTGISGETVWVNVKSVTFFEETDKGTQIHFNHQVANNWAYITVKERMDNISKAIDALS